METIFERGKNTERLNHPNVANFKNACYQPFVFWAILEKIQIGGVEDMEFPGLLNSQRLPLTTGFLKACVHYFLFFHQMIVLQKL